ncbi:MAG: phosphate acyltransferase PlsX [Planctomycetaceae bacterium]|nr:phosphate acyltransferase PlsX [Planctomycetaceae bacterium]
MRLALDVMGGDHGAGPNVAGAVLAVKAIPDLTVALVGDQAQIEALLAAASAPTDRIEIVHAPQFVDMKEKPTDALRKKPDASIFRCWQMLAEGNVEGLVSAGNTGAVVVGAMKTRKFIKCIQKPGIATIMPTARGRCIIVDVGANVFPKPRHLLEYGVMGSVFARKILGIAEPTLGLMNVGEEEGKGHDLVQKTYDMFRASALRDRFVGNIEGRDIHRGTVDVVVTDGFTGNVVLKLCEGVFEFVMNLVNQDVLGALDTEKDKGTAAVKGLLGKYHYSAFGGAPLLGVDGVCIICHGSSKERAIANAIGVAATGVREKVNDAIVAEVEALPKEE